MRVLVIKHGALGDIVLAFPAFAGIRAAYPAAEIVLLTTASFVAFLRASPWFDAVVADDRPAPWQLGGLLKLRRRLRGFDQVFDLQTSARSSRYFLLAGRPPWSGIAKGASAPHRNPGRNAMHTRERLAEQLEQAGIGDLPRPDVSWLRAPSGFKLPPRYALLAPGAAPHRPEKRWPAQKFGGLAAQLALPAVVVGSAAETPLAAAIRPFAHRTIDLTGKTDLSGLGAVIAGAVLAVGNDTGPMHLAAALGVPSLILFSGDSDPALTAPRYPDGGWPRILREPHLSGLSVAKVVAALP